MAGEQGDLKQSIPSPKFPVLTKSVLLKLEIHGFLIGGEKRLLFSEVCEELCRRGIQREEIFQRLKLLQLQLTEATTEQKSLVAKEIGLGNAAALGEQYLIRQTDAERLCGAVCRANKIATESHMTKNTFKVQHEIFGKSRGMFIPELYTKISAECISCIQCRALLSPQEFVRHNHSPPKYQVRHWGLESTRWYRYVFVAKDQANREHYQRVLDELKHRYSIQDIENVATEAVQPITFDEESSSSANKLSIFAGYDSDVKNIDSVEAVRRQQQNLCLSLYNFANNNSHGSNASLAEIMASAVAAASSSAALTPQQNSSSFVPPPNIRLQDVFRSTSAQRRSPSELDEEEVGAKRLKVDSSSSPLSAVSYDDNTSISEAALAAVAAVSSHTRAQSDSASLMALPAQILLNNSRPFLCDKQLGEASTTSFPMSKTLGNDFRESDEEAKDSLLREHVADEMGYLKRAFVKGLSSLMSFSEKTQNSTSCLTEEVDGDSAKSIDHSNDEDIQITDCERKVEKIFQSGALDEFVCARAKHHSQTFEQAKSLTQIRPSSSNGAPAPKHMTVMGKYLTELQDNKIDLEDRVRGLSEELSRFKEENTSLSRRLAEKEQEVVEMRLAFNTVFSNERSNSHQEDALFSYQAHLIQQRRALLMLAAGDKANSSCNLASSYSLNTLLSMVAQSSNAQQVE